MRPAASGERKRVYHRKILILVEEDCTHKKKKRLSKRRGFPAFVASTARGKEERVAGQYL